MNPLPNQVPNQVPKQVPLFLSSLTGPNTGAILQTGKQTDRTKRNKKQQLFYN